jgi:hypothetical protein
MSGIAGWTVAETEAAVVVGHGLGQAMAGVPERGVAAAAGFEVGGRA